MHSFERHIVLVAPDIHWNTGNIGRTCLGAGAFLHLIQPLGFSIHDRAVKRAGLDYWEKVRCRVWENMDHFMTALSPKNGEMVVFSKTGQKLFWELPAKSRLFLVFGSETKGLPAHILSTYKNATYRIPISTHIRSLNLSTSVGIALYESLKPIHDQSVLR
jgi:tRNA (cytidine/uridine-2'-O-)-methyltransferase